MKIIELILDEKDIEMGVYAVSVVDEPAIEENFVALNKQSIELATVDKEKRILMGPALIPNKQIYRKNEKHGEFYIYFSEDTVRKASEMFLINSKHHNATYEHDKQLDGMTVVESWIIDNPEQDKSTGYGFSLPKGTWMISMKVNNADVWSKVKDGDIKGFSIEGYFADKYEMSLKRHMDEEKEYLIEQIKKVMKGEELAEDSYNDYPAVVRRNARKGIELNAKNGNKCATQVGKIRAQQISNGENLSVTTIKRMYSYLSRAEVYYDNGDSESCGYISYLLWGGKAGLQWSESKLKQIETNLAEIGDRGGVKKSPKAPNSDTKNPNPKGEGTAKGDAGGKTGAEVPKDVEETLINKAKDFNERYKEKLGYGANLGALKAVYNRGLGAFNVSHSPKVSSAKQWAMARVNAFLYLIKNDRPENPKYTNDFDLLPTKHPKYNK